MLYPQQKMILMQPIIYIFTNDLRLSDNPGFYQACQSGYPVLPCFILENKTPELWALGGASRWWLHHSLAALQESIRELNGCLLLLSGNWQEIAHVLAKETNAHAIYWSAQYEPYARKQTKKLAELAKENEIDVQVFNSYLLFHPDQIKTKTDQFQNLWVSRSNLWIS